MALSSTLIQRLPGIGGYDLRVIKVTGDASYPTGGYAVTPALFGFTRFATDELGTGLPPVAGNYAILGDAGGNPYSVINPANGNLQLFVATTGVEVANTTSETGFSAFLEAFGS